jgi:hypothetical protein
VVVEAPHVTLGLVPEVLDPVDVIFGISKELGMSAVAVLHPKPEFPQIAQDASCGCGGLGAVRIALKCNFNATLALQRHSVEYTPVA